ncbi:hypothetical protein NOR53_3178 [gamma proteobacterium NOR5-3]|nr:hypothetical protein NOR53_3178 [gamma proteobacterium NOR5-3]
MKAKLEDLPQVRPELGDAVRGSDWGEMASGLMTFPKGMDFCPLLEGLENNLCQCPHWGYMMTGQVKVTYSDGRTETVCGGEMYYWPPGHTILLEEDSQYVEFSPKEQMADVLAHVVSKMSPG